MDDLISRIAARDVINTYGQYANKHMRMHLLLNELNTIPAVDAMIVRHGRWINHKDEHQCSECKEITIVDFYVWRNVQFDYCPYCGARMDGDDNDV